MAEAPATTTAGRTPPLPDEAAVIVRAADGDRTAFAQLMEHYQSASYGIAWRILGDPAPAADATQDAVLHAHKAINSSSGTWSAPCGCCRTTSAWRSCCATCMGWITTRWRP